MRLRVGFNLVTTESTQPFSLNFIFPQCYLHFGQVSLSRHFGFTIEIILAKQRIKFISQLFGLFALMVISLVCFMVFCKQNAMEFCFLTENRKTLW